VAWSARGVVARVASDADADTNGNGGSHCQAMAVRGGVS
jgi:hypothetical protein